MPKKKEADIIEESSDSDKKPTKKRAAKSLNLDAQEMLKAGLHFGHRTSKVHPKMEPFIYGIRNSVHIIDLEKTKERFESALEFISSLVSEGKAILFVGTKIQWKDLVKKTAEDVGFPYVTERWLGGTFTNLKTIEKRVSYFKELKEKKSTGELEKYPQKEKADFEKELKDLTLKFGGIENMEGLPSAVFVLDMKKDALAIREAKRMEIKVIGVADTNVDPTLADYVIPANDDAISSVKYILERVKEVIQRTKPKATKDKIVDS